MPIDTQTPGSPGWWLARLLKQLGDRRPQYDLLDSYMQGTAAVPTLATRAVRQAYARLMAFARTNYAELVVDALRERMNPIGFRTGAAGDDNGDAEAWRIWQANDLDIGLALALRMKFSMGDSYVIVGNLDDEIEAPLISIEDPREVITAHDPARRRRTLAGLKVFHDDVWGVDRAFLYLPGWVVQAARANAPHVDDDETRIMSYETGGWEWVGDPQRLAVPGVPVVRFPNRQGTQANSSKGEYETHLSVLDRINYQILQRLEIATMQAFRQRAIKGELPTHDAEGNEIDYDDMFAADPGALWQLPSTADIWESGQVDLGPIRDSVRHDVQDLAAVTRVPLFYLTPDAANGSAEGASLAREGLVFKATDRITETDGPVGDLMSLAFQVMGDDERARRRDMQVIWASPERFSLAERFDAASKAQGAGVPWRTTMSSVLQYTPQEIERMESERAADQLLGADLTGEPAGAA